MSRVDNIESLMALTTKAKSKSPVDQDYIDRYYMWDLKELRKQCKEVVNFNDQYIYDADKLMSGELFDAYGNPIPQYIRELGRYIGETIPQIGGKIIGIFLSNEKQFFIVEKNHVISYKVCHEIIDNCFK